MEGQAIPLSNTNPRVRRKISRVLVRLKQNGIESAWRDVFALDRNRGYRRMGISSIDFSHANAVFPIPVSQPQIQVNRELIGISRASRFFPASVPNTVLSWYRTGSSEFIVGPIYRHNRYLSYQPRTSLSCRLKQWLHHDAARTSSFLSWISRWKNLKQRSKQQRKHSTYCCCCFSSEDRYQARKQQYKNFR